MNAKWCVSTLFIILALLGLSQEQTKASNQQIVLQFEDVELASESAHDDILEAITTKLEILGVNSVEIIENNGAQLSIRYYSDVDAISVKKFLSEENERALSHEEGLPADYPSEELPETYNLVVSDLHQQAEHGVTLNATIVAIQKQSTKTITDPVLLPFCNAVALEQDVLVSTAFKINRTIAIAIDNTSQIIPEVRAGPCTCGNS